ncbi:MAG: hypothetical protein ACD_40C00069G0002, partial [uncultured bacterium]
MPKLFLGLLVVSAMFWGTLASANAQNISSGVAQNLAIPEQVVDGMLICTHNQQNELCQAESD